MPIIVHDCPRCRSDRITFDVKGCNNLGKKLHMHGNWQWWVELFSVCRHCLQGTILVVSRNADVDRDPPEVMNVKDSLNNSFNIERYINLRDNSIHKPPEFTPEPISTIFQEGATCLATQCWNAAGTMFRQCLDIATKSMLPKEGASNLSEHQKKYLAPRINWLIDNQLFPSDLKELATCIREDGNDGAHDGTLGRAEAMDLLDFTTALLESIYTTPEKIKQAEKKRSKRREKTL